MAIQINEDWCIDSDQYNWILQKRVVTKKQDEEGNTSQKVTWRNEGYYPTLPDAVIGLVNQEIKIPADVQKVLAKLDELHSLIEEKFGSGVNFERKRSAPTTAVYPDEQSAELASAERVEVDDDLEDLLS